MGFIAAALLAFGATYTRWFPFGTLLSAWRIVPGLFPPLASLALELGTLGGLPLGFALSLPGAARDRNMALRLLYLPAAFGLIGLLAARHVDRASQDPGSVVTDLVAATRASCSSGVKEVEVPLAKLQVSCSDDRVSGRAPFAGAHFSARKFEPNADLSQMHFTAFELGVPARGSAPEVKLRVAQASFRGLAPWGRSRKASPIVRVVTAWAALMLATGIAALTAFARSFRTPILRGAFVGIGSGVALAFATLAFDRAAGATGSWIWLPLAGVSGAGLASLVFGAADGLILRVKRRHT